VKNQSKIILTALLLGAANIQAHTNKTFLMPRPVGVNLPMEQTTFYELYKHKAPRNKGAGINLQVAGFYQESTNGCELGKYFLVGEKSTIKLQAQETVDTKTGLGINTISTIADVDIGYLIHDFDLSVAEAEGLNIKNTTLSLDPQQKSYGVRLDYHQDLSAIIKGLYLSAHLPIVHVENKLGFRVSSLDKAAQQTFVDFFNGTFTQTDASDLQVALTNAKMDCKKRSTSGVADLDLSLGYNFFDKECYAASLAFAVTIPTGNRPTSQWVFEPIRGNGHHIGLGGDFYSFWRLWGDLKHNLKLTIDAKYRYLLEETQCRTLGIKGKTPDCSGCNLLGRPFGQYYLLGKQGQNALIPAANILTQSVDVTPRNQFDGIGGFTYNCHGFSFDVGYNLYYRDAEKIELQEEDKCKTSSSCDTDCPPCVTCPNVPLTPNTYAIAARSFDTTVPFDIKNGAHLDGGLAGATIIGPDTIDFDAASTPQQLTHSIYGGLGFQTSGSTCFMFGVGGKYEWPSTNSALEQWGVWGKVGLKI